MTEFAQQADHPDQNTTQGIEVPEVKAAVAKKSKSAARLNSNATQPTIEGLSIITVLLLTACFPLLTMLTQDPSPLSQTAARFGSLAVVPQPVRCVRCRNRLMVAIRMHPRWCFQRFASS